MEFFINGLAGAGIFFPLTLAVFWPGRICGQDAIAAMVAGVGANLGWKLIFPTLLDGLLASIIVLLITQWVTRGKGHDLADIGKEK